MRIVQRYFNVGIGRPTLAKEEGISSGMLSTCIYKFLDGGGEDSLESKRKQGNHFSALHTSKSLSEIEQLRLLVAKQEIKLNA